MSKLLLLPLLFLLSVIATEQSKQPDIADFPYLVSVRRDGRHVCSGALVHESWTITPASCIYDSAVPRISVFTGSMDLYRRSTEARIFHVSKIIVHQSFDKDLLTNDIAMLKDGSVLHLVGWRGSKLSVEKASLVNQRSCINSMPRYRALTSKMFCATNANLCQLDIGAVLANDDVLVGLLSSVDAKCVYPGVYIRLGSFLPWINKILSIDGSLAA